MIFIFFTSPPVACMLFYLFFFFFFSSRRRHTRYWRDWSSDVCSSDLEGSASYWSAARSRCRSRGRRPTLPGHPRRGRARVRRSRDRGNATRRQGAEQIGRASCRERGESRVVDRRCKKKEKGDVEGERG